MKRKSSRYLKKSTHLKKTQKLMNYCQEKVKMFKEKQNV